MEFKNSEFEKNAAKTLQTLQELKTKLNNNFSTKGPEQLNQAIKAVDVSPITKGLDTVQLKFNALQIAGKRVIENITDAAMNAIHKVTNLIQAPLNQIKQGGAARAQNIEQAKFMLSGLGIEWKDIVDDINYGVQDTAYGLDAAAKVASQLVASNVQLGADMQASLRGVSGVAAMTNSTYEEIGHIFTSVAGQGKLMSMQLQQFSLRGLNVAADLAKSMGTTEAAIREMVTKGQIDFMTFARAMDELYGGHAKEANNTFTGALSNTKAALSRLGADIQSQKFESFRIILLDVTAQLKELKKAIKPAEDAIISMMDAVGKLVSSFIKSINIKGIVNRIVPAIEKAANFVRDFADAWRELREEKSPVSNIAEYVQKLKGGMSETKEATDEAITSIDKLARASEKDLKKYADNAWAIWNEGKFGNGQDRINALGEDYELTQAYVEKMIELGWDEAKMTEYLTEQRKKADVQQKKANTVNKLKETVSKVFNIFTNVKRVIGNVASSIGNILGAMFSGLGDAFSGQGKGLLDGVVSVTDAIADFSDKIAITKERAEKIRPIMKFIGDTFITIAKGIYTAVKYLVNFIKTVSQSKIIKGIFEAIRNAINGIVDGVTKIYTKLKESGALDKIIDILKTIATWVGERIIDAFTLLGDVASSIGDGIISLFDKLSSKMADFSKKSEDGSTWLGKIRDFFKEDILNGSWITKLKDALKDIFGSGKDVFQNAYDFAHKFGDGLLKGFNSISLDDIYEGSKIVGFILTLGSIIRWINSLTKLNKNVAGMAEGIGDLCDSIVTVLKKYGKKLDAESFSLFADGIIKIVGSIIALVLVMALVPGAREVTSEAARIVEVIMLLYGLIFVVKAWMIKTKGAIATVQIKTARLQIAALFIGIAAMVTAVINSIKSTYDLLTSNTFSIKAFVGALLVVAASIGAVVAVMNSMIRQVEDRGGSIAVAGIAGLFTGIAMMIYAMSKAIDVINDIMMKKGNHAWSAFGMISLMFAEISVMLGVILGLTKNTNIINNPFKGIMTVFLSITALMRFGLVPLIEAIDKTLKTGDSGTIDAVLIILGVITAMSVALTVLVAKSKTGSSLGTAAIFIGIAAAVLAISHALTELAKVDLSDLTAVALILGGFISVIIAVVGVLSMLGGVKMLAIAAVLVGIGAAAYLCAKAFESLLNSLGILVKFLGTAMESLMGFFEGVVLGIDKIRKPKLSSSEKKNIDNYLSEQKDEIDKYWGKSNEEILSMEVEGPAASVAWAKAPINHIDKGKFETDEEYDAYMAAYKNGTLKEIKKEAEADAKVHQDYYVMSYEEALVKQQEANPPTFKQYDKESAEIILSHSAEKNAAIKEAAQNLALEDSENIEDAYQKTVENYFSDSAFPEVDFGDITNINIDKDTLKKEFNEWYSGFDLGAMGIDAQTAADTYMTNYNDYIGLNALESGEDAFNMFNNGFTNAAGQYDYSALTDSFAKFGDVNSTFTSLGTEIPLAIDVGIQDKKDVLYETMKTIPTESVTILRSYYNEWYKAGAYLTEGLANGITDKYPRELSEKNISDVVWNLKRRVEKDMKIESPSKVFHKLGEFMTMGLANGISDSAKFATASTEEVGKATILSMRETLKKISMEATNELDTSPRITPVLDLSNVTEGINTMNGMIDTSHAVGLAGITSTEARASARSRIEAMYQNGSNYDDTNAIGAIQSLQSEVSTLKDAINGMQVVIDGRALVGQIATPMEKTLNNMTLQTGRGVR